MVKSNNLTARTAKAQQVCRRCLVGVARMVSRRSEAAGLADGLTNTHVRLQIRRLRLLRGWTQQQLARAAGLSPSSLGCLETGFYRLNVDTLDKILAALNVDIADIWPSPEDKNSAESDFSLLPGINQVSFFRVREVHLLSSAEASCLFIANYSSNGGGADSGNGSGPPALRSVYTINVEEKERLWVAQLLKAGTLATPWIKYSYCQKPLSLFLCLKNASMQPWIESLIGRYMPAWLAAFQV